MSSSISADKSSVELSVVQKKVKKMGGRKVSPAAREAAVRRIVEDGVAKDVIARELSVTEYAVAKWLRDHNMVSDMKAQIDKLESEVRRLKGENSMQIEECKRLEVKLEVQKDALMDLLRYR